MLGTDTIIGTKLYAVYIRGMLGTLKNYMKQAIFALALVCKIFRTTLSCACTKPKMAVYCCVCLLVPSLNAEDVLFS